MSDVNAAGELWVRFAGMFGAETLSRKYGDRPPEEWVKVVGKLRRPEFERGLRRMLHSGKPHIPTLPEFLRLCREVGGDDSGGNPEPLKLSAPLQPPPDKIVREASKNLLREILRAGHRWGPERGDRAGRHEADTLIIVRWKNEWVRLMRSADDEERVANHRQWWRQCMSSAWAEIDGPPRATTELEDELEGWG
jgi:hypothetical protein